MSKNFLKRYIKPLLQQVGLYKMGYHVYFLCIQIVRSVVNRFNKIFYKTAPILLYHRIYAPSSDPVMLCVTPECFERHLKFLKSNYDVISLPELSKRIFSGTLKGNETAITFDDGYQDNLTYALHLLEKYDLPATIFITTGFLGKKASFEWDMEYSENDRAVFLSEEEIKILSKHPLIEIGAHTETHARLSTLTPEEQRIEISKNKQTLERIIEKDVVLFAYPFGGYFDFDANSKKLVGKLGFSFAYSNITMLAKCNSEKYSIPRINIREISVSELSQKLLTFK